MPDENKPDDSLDENLKPEDQSAVDEAADAANVAGEAEASSGEGQADSGSEEAASAAESADDSSVAVEEASAEVDGVAEDGSAESGENMPDDPNKIVNEDDASEDDAEEEMLAMMEDEAESASSGVPNGDDFPDLSGVKMEPTASPAEFQQLTPISGGESSNKNIDMLLDIKMPISIELGRTEMPISELLALGPGSVVELNKLAGEPVDLLVNDKIIARGEVVVVDENFGVRITLLMSPEERLKSLAQA